MGLEGLVVFAYSFPHRKTQDFLSRLCMYNIKPKVVIASPPKRLSLPSSFLRDKFKHVDLIHPKVICDLQGIEYVEMDHSDPRLPDLLLYRNLNIGIISGARILKDKVIKILGNGILNFHPGLIPQNRGLNAVKWAVYLDIPQAMTVHLIDNKVDAGRVLRRYLVPVFSDDTLIDVNLRVYELQVRELVDVIYNLEAELTGDLLGVVDEAGYHPPANSKIDEVVLKKFHAYLNKWSYDINGWMCVCGCRLTPGDKEFVCIRCGRKYREKNGFLLEDLSTTV